MEVTTAVNMAVTMAVTHGIHGSRFTILRRHADEQAANSDSYF